MFAISRRGSCMLYKECNIPKCSANEVLVKVKAASINPIDLKLIWPIGNAIVGMDFAGIIEELGSNISTFQVGDEVYGTCKGSLAEYAVATVTHIAIKPQNISFEEAASMPIAYVTSLQGLTKYGSLKEGGSILVIGASGGCGVAAIKLAKALGASMIVGVCSGKNAEFVLSQGATEVIDYTKEDIVNYCSKNGEVTKAFDIVYDAVTASGGDGEGYKSKSLKLLKCETPNEKHGQYVAITGSASMWVRAFTIGQKKNEHLVVMNFDCYSDLDRLTQLVERGELKPFIGKQLEFNAVNVEKGFELLKSRRAVGKIVYKIS